MSHFLLRGGASVADGVITLPGVIRGLPGFTLAVKVKLTDGTTISHGAALRRTR